MHCADNGSESCHAPFIVDRLSICYQFSSRGSLFPYITPLHITSFDLSHYYFFSLSLPKQKHSQEYAQLKMDDDGYAVQGRRRRGANREPARDRDRASFLREVPKYAGTPENFDRAHAQRYGREEGLGPDGKHNHGSYEFPHGSDRQRLHTQYSASTRARDVTRGAYREGLRAANEEYEYMDAEQQKY